MTTTYNFDAQLAQGQTGEQHLDQHFSRWYTIRPATASDQRRGIDRWYTRPNGETFPVEYKTDRTAGRTGNAFIETTSVDTTNRNRTYHTIGTLVPLDELEKIAVAVQ